MVVPIPFCELNHRGNSYGGARPFPHRMREILFKAWSGRRSSVHRHKQEIFIPHTPFLYKTWYNRRTFTLFLLTESFVVRTSKVLYPQFLYEIPFYV